MIYASKTVANPYSHYRDADGFMMSPMNLAPFNQCEGSSHKLPLSSMSTKFRDPKAVLINYRT